MHAKLKTYSPEQKARHTQCVESSDVGLLIKKAEIPFEARAFRAVWPPVAQRDPGNALG